MSNESKVYQGLNSLRKEFCAFRSEHNVGDIYSYMKNINYFFDKDDKPIDRMESLMYLIASMTSDEHLQAYIDEACFRCNTRKASQVERFLDMFFMSIGLVIPNREFVLCKDG